jgi:hypothetical protein
VGLTSCSSGLMRDGRATVSMFQPTNDCNCSVVAMGLRSRTAAR